MSSLAQAPSKAMLLPANPGLSMKPMPKICISMDGRPPRSEPECHPPRFPHHPASHPSLCSPGEKQTLIMEHLCIAPAHPCHCRSFCKERNRYKYTCKAGRGVSSSRFPCPGQTGCSIRIYLQAEGGGAGLEYPLLIPFALPSEVSH